MLTTITDAKTMWCPFVRIEGSNRYNNALTDGFENTPEPYHCLGAKCMAWRASHAAHLKANVEKRIGEHGYCGLAGRPEIDAGY